MKISFLRKTSLFVALLVLLSLTYPVSFAQASAAADVILVSDIANLRFSNFSTKNNTTEAGMLTVEKEYHDNILDKNVVRYSSSAYAEGNSMYNTISREARLYVLGTSGSNTFTETLYNQNDHKYLRLQYKLYLENATDGLAFRINRYNVGGEGALTLDTTTGYYFAVGGSNFTDSVVANSNLTTGYSYTYKGLNTENWHDVIIELGTDTQNNTIKFFIDGSQVNVTEIKHTYNSTTAKVEKTTTSPATNVYTFPANTSGFGSRGENYSVLVPKGVKGTTDAPNPFGIRISDCKIVTTNSEVDTTVYDALPKVVYTLDNQKTLTRSAENDLTTEYVQAPHFSNEFSKNVLHIQSGEKGYGNGSTYTASNYTEASNAPIFSTVSKANETIGNIMNYDSYKYFRTSFNIYINNEVNGIYIKGDRLADGAVTNAHNFIFCIGGSKFNTLSSKATRHVHTNKGLSVGRWHNVVIELGSNAGNTTINYYIGGKLSDFTYAKFNGAEDKTFVTETSLYGWGGASTNRCGIVPKSNYGEELDMYLSDFVMTATNEKYETPVEIKIVSSKTTSVKVKDNTVYSYGAIADGECSSLFETVGADYVGALENGKLIMLYNGETGSMRYYDVVTLTDADIPYETGLHIDNLEAVSADNYAEIKGVAYNLTDDYAKKVKLVVTYIKDGILTECYTKDIPVDGKLVYLDEKITRKVSSYDSMRAFVWSDLNTMEILGEYAE